MAQAEQNATPFIGQTCTMSFRWEEDLRRSFQRHADHAIWSTAEPNIVRYTVQESTCSEGRADWVWAASRNGWPGHVCPEIAALLLQPTCSRVLSHLQPKATRSDEYLNAKSGVTAGTFRRWLTQLIEIGLVTEVGERAFVRGPLFPELDLEICAFEFKLANWRRALYQAIRYRTFSHRVFVVMPPKAVRPALAGEHIFRQFNVGLLTHDQQGNSTRIMSCRKQAPTSRQQFIRAVGMFLNQKPSDARQCPE